MSAVDHHDPVDRVLQRALADGAARSDRLGADHGRLWTALAQATRGGKRFRPALVLAAHDALAAHRPALTSTSGTDTPAATVGAAVELLHTAFVVHDDVIDGDEVRRGAPNVTGTFAAEARRAGVVPSSARRYGEAAGILAGDLALVSAVRLVARCGAPAAVTDRLLDLLEDTVHATATGELADVRLGVWAGRLSPAHDGGPGTDADGALDQTLDQALDVAALKTAVYSFELPLVAGAVLAGASEELIGALSRIGRLVGLGFQLLDDLLGVFGDPERSGKSVLTDLREGKYTALLAHARTTVEWPRLRPLVGNPTLQDHDAGRARDLLERCGARSRTERLAERYLSEALAEAARPPVPPALAEVVTGLVERIRAAAADGSAREPSTVGAR